MRVAGVAHLVERHLAKVEVASSSLVTRSKHRQNTVGAFLFCGQYCVITSATFSRSFAPEMRYFFLPYTKYACEKLPFSDVKSQAECSCRIVQYCPVIF